MPAIRVEAGLCHSDLPLHPRSERVEDAAGRALATCDQDGQRGLNVCISLRLNGMLLWTHWLADCFTSPRLLFELSEQHEMSQRTSCDRSRTTIDLLILPS